jgi:predicted regulator of Ras-like GTPase activity (Roadblock/LC7/MglB family)
MVTSPLSATGSRSDDHPDVTEAYVGIKDGTVRAIVVDDTRDADQTAKLVADWIKMGRTIERMPLHQAVERIKREREQS